MPPHRPSTRETPARVATIVLLFMAALLFEALTPRAVASASVYVIPVALTLLARNASAPIWATAISTLLIAAGYWLSPVAPPGVPPWLGPLNRTIGIGSLWVLGIAARSFVRTRIDTARRDWIRAGDAELARAVAGEKTVDDLGDAALRALVRHVECDVGALYVRGPDRRFHRRAAVGLAPGAVAEAFGPGEGILGRVAVEGRPHLLQDVPPDYLRIASGTGQGAPRQVLAAPVSTDDAVNAVVELASFRPFEEMDRALLQLAGRTLGIALRSAEYRVRLEELLAQTRRQAEQLEAQQEELQATNEELRLQSEQLRESAERLEVQQAELEQANAQLEEQTAELESHRDELTRGRQQLLVRARDLERASRFKSEFLANMSHELRTPLNSTLILARLLEENAEGNLSEEQVRYAHTIHQAGKELLALVNDVLDLAKIEAGRVEIHAEPVAPSRIVEQLGLTFAPMAAEHGLAFERAVDPATPAEIVTDAQRIQQILQNLLSNAFKFTERGGVSLRVAPAGDDRVAFSVEDTGVGIPAEKHEVVFEAFRQADGTTSRRYGGTGLGLSISRELARLLGGTVELRSAVGRGSTFTLVVPREIASRIAEPPAPAAEPAAEGSQPRVVPASQGGPAARPAAPPRRRVLIVEDDPTFAGILGALAHERRFESVVAATAEAALREAFTDPPAAVLLDVGLPDQSGLAVLDRLKHDVRTRHVPVQVISARDHGQAALEMGAVGSAVKPVDRDEIAAAFDRLEARLTRGIRRILVVEPDDAQRERVERLLSGRHLEIVPARSVDEALDRLRSGAFDCVVLDAVIPGASGPDVLESLARSADRKPFPPVIVYAATRPLSREEEARLRRSARSVVVKGARSPERLLDEVTLFLHEVESELSPEQRRLLALARAPSNATSRSDGRRRARRGPRGPAAARGHPREVRPRLPRLQRSVDAAPRAPGRCPPRMRDRLRSPGARAARPRGVPGRARQPHNPGERAVPRPSRLRRRARAGRAAARARAGREALDPGVRVGRGGLLLRHPAARGGAPRPHHSVRHRHPCGRPRAGACGGVPAGADGGVQRELRQGGREGVALRPLRRRE